MNAKHGNFLDLILFLSQYDVTKENHIEDCTKKRKCCSYGSEGGRSSMVTFCVRLPSI